MTIPTKLTGELACILEDCGPPDRQSPEALAELIRHYQPTWDRITAALAATPEPDMSDVTDDVSPDVASAIRHFYNNAYALQKNEATPAVSGDPTLRGALERIANDQFFQGNNWYPTHAAKIAKAALAYQPASPLRGREMDLKTSEEDEALMRGTLLKCYGKEPRTFRISKEHYLYLAEQIVSLREAYRRLETPPEQPAAGDGETKA